MKLLTSLLLITKPLFQLYPLGEPNKFILGSLKLQVDDLSLVDFLKKLSEITGELDIPNAAGEYVE